MFRYKLSALALVALLGVAPLVGCGSDDPTDPGGVSLAGTYDLVTITFQGSPSLGPPAATGTIILTDTTYNISIIIAVPGLEQEIVDSGTYTLSGSNWTQESSTGDLQSVGTYTLSGDILTVDVTTQGQRIITIWDRR